jgi:hypothetical protein
MRKVISTIAIIIFLCNQATAQSKGVTPLHTFFQKNADSTIIIEYATETYDPHSYNIITKTGDTVNAFKYNAVQKYTKTTIPKKLSIMISLEKFKYWDVAADINQYFNLVDLDQDTLKTFWHTAQKLDIWNKVDDKHYKLCPDHVKFAITAHSGGIIIHLVTKDNIKTLFYEHPWYFEEQCPGNINRIAAIKLYEVFKTYLKN